MGRRRIPRRLAAVAVRPLSLRFYDDDREPRQGVPSAAEGCNDVSIAGPFLATVASCRLTPGVLQKSLRPRLARNLSLEPPRPQRLRLADWVDVPTQPEARAEALAVLAVRAP